MSLYALDDLRSTFSNLQGWGYLAFKQLQLEHRRTLLGSVWIVLAFGLTSASIGVLMAQLQGRSIAEHVPYVMFGFVAWNLIATSFNGGAQTMVSAKPYLLQMQVSRSVFGLSLTLRTFYLAIIQLVTAAAVSAALGWRPTLEALWALPALLLMAVATFGLALFLGTLCARWRDISRLIEAVMRLAFFFTPIIWHAGTGRGAAGGFIGFIMAWNPFAYIVGAFRDGLLALPPNPANWLLLLAAAALSLFAGLIALQGFGRKVTLWL